MKRVYLAAAFLGLIVIGCLVTIRLESVRLQELIALTDEMKTHCEQGKTEETLKLAKELEKQFSEKTSAFFLFLHHNILTEIQKCVVSLPVYLENGKTDDFLAELARCQLMLQKQLELELPTLENIL